MTVPFPPHGSTHSRSLSVGSTDADKPTPIRPTTAELRHCQRLAREVANDDYRRDLGAVLIGAAIGTAFCLFLTALHFAPQIWEWLS